MRLTRRCFGIRSSVSFHLPLFIYLLHFGVGALLLTSSRGIVRSGALNGPETRSVAPFERLDLGLQPRLGFASR